MKNLYAADKEIYDIVNAEIKRQKEGIELIASENIVSKAVLEVSGSEMTSEAPTTLKGRGF